ncbi:hypothetical protein GBA52_022443 [Prunus armeniaca]|nr:hypothetical protein GBA52_022443 [Prunus armeniaca]
MAFIRPKSPHASEAPTTSKLFYGLPNMKRVGGGDKDKSSSPEAELSHPCRAIHLLHDRPIPH